MKFFIEQPKFMRKKKEVIFQLFRHVSRLKTSKVDAADSDILYDVRSLAYSVKRGGRNYYDDTWRLEVLCPSSWAAVKRY